MINAFGSYASLDTLRSRAEALRKIRHFFFERAVLEVETPSLSLFPTIDLHLESFESSFLSSSKPLYLITSPEYHMKRLVASGAGSIYQICKAFRNGEKGIYHNPEFTILEWYRVGWNHHQLIDEIDALLQLILGTPSAKKSTYRQIFLRYTGIDPFAFTIKDFQQACTNKECPVPEYLLQNRLSDDEYLNYLMGALIEPQLGMDQPEFVVDYPSTQACLARINEKEPETAARFELFYRGVELANGFYELTNAEEQENRFKETNQQRIAVGKKPLPIDQRFLAALRNGLPDCAGVAMGIDRLLMLANDVTDMANIVSFPYESC